MASIFSDPSLFAEFEQGNSVPVKPKFSHVKLDIDSPTDREIVDAEIKTHGCLADNSSVEHIKRLENEIQQLKEKNEALRHENMLINLRRSGGENNDRPILQILFMNDAIARKCKSDIENLLQDVIKQDSKKSNKEDNQPLTLRPNFVCLAPQNEGCKDELMNESIIRLKKMACTVIGCCHYYKDFIVDMIGWPLVEYNPSVTDSWNIPVYEQLFKQPLPCSDSVDEGNLIIINKDKRPKASCFNCGGDHSLNVCKAKKDQERINIARHEFMDRFSPSGATHAKPRYHIEDDPKFSHMKPGTISQSLRDALGISLNELPPYIYQMRVLGYPPGHLENAKQQTSGLSMFVKHGAVMSTNGKLLEDGEVDEDTMQMCEYDFDKIVDYPGFNIEPSIDIKDESERLGMPPMSLQWKKDVMKLTTLKKMNGNSSKRSRSSDAWNGEKHFKIDLDSIVDMDIEDNPLKETIPILEFVAVSSSSSLPAEPLEELPPLPLESPPFPLSAHPSREESPQPEQLRRSNDETEESSETLMIPRDLICSKSFCKPSVIITVVPDWSGGSVGYSLGTPLAFPDHDGDSESHAEIKELPDASKFAAGVSDMIFHENLSNATGTFDRLRKVLNKTKM